MSSLPRGSPPGPSLPRTVSRALARVRTRDTTWRIIQGMVDGALVGGGLSATALVAFKLGWAPMAWWGGAWGGVLAAMLVALLRPAWRRPSALHLAKRLDDACGLADRASTAVAFVSTGLTSAFAVAAIDDAGVATASIDARRAAPFTWPRRITWAVGAAVALVAAWFWWPQPNLARGVALAVLGLKAPEVPRARWNPDAAEDLADIQQQAEALAAELDALDDAEASELARMLEELARQLAEGALTPDEALRRLAELEQGLAAREAAQRQVLAEVEQRLRSAAAALSKAPDLKGLAAALERGDLERAAQELDALASAAKTAQDRDRLARELDALADTMKSDVERDIDRLKREMDRLAQKEKEDRLRPKEKDRLAKKRKELERLERQRKEQEDSGNQKRLQRLTREMNKAAEDLRRRQQEQQQEAQQAVRRAADELRRLSEEQKKQRALARGGDAAEDLREMLRRAGQSRGNQDGEQGEGGRGGGKSQRQKLKDFLVRAGKRGGQPAGGKDGEEGKQQRAWMLDGEGKGDGERLQLLEEGIAEGEGSSPTGGSGAGSGDEAGTEADPNPTLGEATELAGTRQDTAVKGKRGDGPSLAEVIGSSAAEGFSTSSWREIHADYSSIVEEDMEREELPVGYRRYVERYFDLIRPPDTR